MRTCVLVALLVVSLSGGARAPTPPAQDSGAGAATGAVYFYYHGFEQPAGMFGPTPSIAILVDGHEVANPKRDTYFGITVMPGRHTFASRTRRTNPRETAIELDIAPGQQVFIRLDMVIAALGWVKWTANLRIVDPEEGRVMLAAMQPLEIGHIEDKARVTTERPAPREISDTATDAADFPAPLPDEQGIYFVTDRTFRKLPGEITTLRTTSVHGLTASLNQTRSGVRLKAPLEFVIRCAEETTASEYVLMQLFTRRDRREFRTLEGGDSSMRQGPERMTVPFVARRIAPNVYRVTVLAVPKGEYGFVAPGSAFEAAVGATSTTYTFGVD